MTLRDTGLLHMSKKVNVGVVYQRGVVMQATSSTHATLTC